MCSLAAGTPERCLDVFARDAPFWELRDPSAHPRPPLRRGFATVYGIMGLSP